MLPDVTTRTPTTKAATPWGPATGVEDTATAASGDKRFASIVQLLEDGEGERLVRFAYATERSRPARPGYACARVTSNACARPSAERPALAEALFGADA